MIPIMTNKTLLFVVDRYFPHVGGAEVVYQKIAEFLVRQGWQVEVVTTSHPDREKETMINGVHVTSVGRSRYAFTFAAFPMVWRLAREATIIQTATYNGAPVSWLVAKLRHKPPVYLMVHELLGSLWFKTMGWFSATVHFCFERFILWLPFNRYAAVSDFTRQQLIHRGIPEQKITRIYHGIDESFQPGPAEPDLRNQLGYQSDDFVLLFFGRPGVIKGAGCLVKAMQGANDPRIKLLMLLPEEKIPGGEDIRRLAHGDSRILILPSVVREKLPHYLAMADAVVAPSLQEGFGFSAVEACTAGRLVIASSAGALPETLFGKVIWTKPGDPQSLVHGIMKALRGEWEIIPKKTFSWDNALRQYLELYENSYHRGSGG